MSWRKLAFQLKFVIIFYGVYYTFTYNFMLVIGCLFYRHISISHPGRLDDSGSSS